MCSDGDVRRADRQLRPRGDELDGQRGEAARHLLGPPLRDADDAHLGVGEAGDQFLHGDDGHQAGERRADARVDPRTEGQDRVLGGVGAERVERVGVGVDALVPVRRRDQRQDPRVLGDRDAVDGHRRGGLPCGVLHRALVAEDLLHERLDERRLVAEPALQVGEPVEQRDAVRQQRGRHVGRRRQQQVDQPGLLRVVEHPGAAGFEDQADHVGSVRRRGLRAPLAQDLGDVRLDLAVGRRGVGGQAELPDRARHRRDRPLQEVLGLGGRDPEQAQRDVEHERERVVGGDVAATARPHRRQQVAARLPDRAAPARRSGPG